MPPDPPSNGEYMIAAYVVAAVILIGYWVRLWRKARELFGEPGRREGVA